MKNEAKKLREDIAEIVDEVVVQDPTLLEILQNKKLTVTTEIYENWYNKDDTVKTKDIANREKFLIDSVFKALDIDDKFIFTHQMIKKQCDEKERAIVTIDVI